MIQQQILSDKVETSLTVALLVAFLLNIKKVLVANVLGDSLFFNEYLDISVYFFDGIFLSWLIYILLKHKISILSIYKEMFHVELFLKTISLLLAGVILWQWLSVIQAEQIPLAVRNALTMTEIGIFILVQIFRMFHVEHEEKNRNVPCGTQGFPESILIKTMVFFALFNAFIVFIQVSTQHSVGLKYLGESFLQVGNPGVATLSIFGEKILRGYGLFTHPNILAAFLGLTLLAMFTQNVPRGTLLPIKLKSRLLKMFHVEQLVEVRQKSMFHVEHWAFLVIIMALVLTFSRTGIVVTIIACLLIVPRGTISALLEKCSKKLFHVEHVLIALVPFFIIATVLSTSKSFSERELSLLEYAELSQFDFLGNGIGSYPVKLYSQIYSMNEWSIQPIHNYFLFTYYEIGFLGLFLVISLLMNVLTFRRDSQLFHVEQSERVSVEKMFHVEQLKQRVLKRPFVIGFFLIALALGDHFFYTIPQGQVIFWLGILLALNVPPYLSAGRRGTSE